MRAGRLAMIRGQIGDLPAAGLDTGPTTAIHRLSYIARYRPLASPPTATRDNKSVTKSRTRRPLAVAFQSSSGDMFRNLTRLGRVKLCEPMIYTELLRHDLSQALHKVLRYLLGILASFAIFTTNARADCVCRCVNGRMVPLCSNVTDTPPFCPTSTCPITSPPGGYSGAAPPVGTQRCFQAQVLNPNSGQYEWQTICR